MHAGTAAVANKTDDPRYVCVCVCQRSLLRGELKSHTISPLSLSLSVRLDEAAGMDCVLT